AGLGGPNTHGDYLQVYGPTIDATHILYNTLHQVGGITQGFIADNTKTGEIGGNTMLGDVSAFISVSGTGTKSGNHTSAFVIDENYFDTSNAFYFCYPAIGAGDAYPLTVFTHNVNMVTGALETD